jgi:hypothetical protein
MPACGSGPDSIPSRCWTPARSSSASSDAPSAGLATGRAASTSTCCCSGSFVLVPLLELDPELALPGGERLAQRLRALGPGQAVRRAGPPLL